MSKRKAFNFYVSYFDTFNELSDADKLKFITALLNKQFLGIEPELKGISKLAYNSQKHSINQQVEGYENKTKQKLNKGGAIGGAEGGSVQEKEKGKEKEEIRINTLNNFLSTLKCIGPNTDRRIKRCDLKNNYHLEYRKHFQPGLKEI
jgi:hypothetical protein